MASVYERAGRWYVRYRDGMGRWRDKVTKAESKTEARRLAGEFERRGWRQREGLEALPSDTSETLAELCEWWLKECCAEPSRARDRNRLDKHILRHPIGKLALPRVRAVVVEQRLHEMELAGSSANTVNLLRAVLHSIFARAIRAGKWSGLNPIAGVVRRRVPKVDRPTLRAEEVPLVLAHVPRAWRNLFAAAVYLGLRKGELFGLRKEDVDLPARLVKVTRSYDRKTTKGGHVDLLPIPEPVVPYLQAALEASECELVFPDEDGKMRTEEADPQKVLRRALAHAHLVDGWDHICRWCKGAKAAQHTWRHPDPELRRCPSCGKKLWPKALPRRMRFHDLRHSTATLLLRANAPLQHVSRILRHSDIRLTANTYGHLVVEDLRAAMATLPAAALPEVPFRLPAKGVGGADPEALAASLLQDLENTQSEGPKPVGNPQETSAPSSSAPSRIRTCGPRIRSSENSICRPYQNLSTVEDFSAFLAKQIPGLFKDSIFFEKICCIFAARISKTVPGTARKLLSVRQVAERIGVSAPLVYRAIERGELAHVRVSNAIRVAPADLDAYVARQKRRGVSRQR